MAVCKGSTLTNYQIFNAIKDYLAIIDTEFNVISINSEYLKLLEKDESEIIGQKCYLVLKGSLCLSKKCPLKQIVRKRKVVEFETEKRLSNGKNIPLILTATPFTSDNGELIGIIQSFKNITALKLSKKKLEIVLDDMIKALAAVVEARDPYTSGHQDRVAQIAMSLSQSMGLPGNKVKTVWLAASAHDVGKIYVPSGFLAKPGKLSNLEFAIMKSHAEVGYSILKEISFERPVADIVHQHHERMDGSGYPLGLSGDDIMLEARILAVADVVEAMSSHRPYRPALGNEKALHELSKNKGILYDPEVVDTYLEMSNISLNG